MHYFPLAQRGILFTLYRHANLGTGCTCGAAGTKTRKANFSRFSWWGVPAVVFGSGAAAKRVLNALTNRELGVRVTAVVSSDFSYLPRNVTAEYAILAEPPQKIALHHMIQDHCQGYRHVLLVPDIQGICSLGISARDIGGEIGFDVQQRLFHRSAGMMKRAIDLFLTLPGLIVLSPVFVLIAAAIKLTSSGPVVYRHTRHGRDGKTFSAFKFRTMHRNGESLLLEHFQKNPEERASWQRDRKLKRDPRVNAVGRWLAGTAWMSFRNFAMFLTGQMSLVGPRPIVSAEY